MCAYVCVCVYVHTCIREYTRTKGGGGRGGQNYFINIHTIISVRRRRERDNVVYWKPNRKIINDVRRRKKVKWNQQCSQKGRAIKKEREKQRQRERERQKKRVKKNGEGGEIEVEEERGY